jgi:uncharacterized BrkB/YihY/UPF0761 family membrane protein
MIQLQRARRVSAIIVAISCSVCISAAAQVQDSKVTDDLQWALNLLIAACVVIFTALFIFAGIEIASKHKRLIDIWHIIVGAGIAASAGVYASQFVK